VHDGIYREAVGLPTSGYAGSPITIVAADGARPVLSGAGEVTGWAACSAADVNNNPNHANIYRADIAWRPTSLFEDNQPLTKARTPWRHPADGGTTTSLVDPVNITEPDGYWADGGEVFMWIRSGTTHHHREILTHTGSTITFADLGYGWTPDAEDLYWLQNKVDLIDEPGDWAVADNGDGTYRVFLWPLDSDDPAGHLIEGSADYGPFLVGWGKQSHWIIDGLEIRHSDNHGVGSWAAGAHHITVRNCMIHHNGGTGIYGRCNHYGHYYRNYVGHNSTGISNGDNASNTLIEENEVDTNTHDGVIVNLNNVVLRRNYIHGHMMWGHADNVQTYGDVDDLLFEDNFIFNAGQSIMMAETDGVTYRNNAIVGCHAYMVIAGHQSTFNVTLDANTLMFPGYGAVNTSGDMFNFTDNIFFLGHGGGAYGMTDEHTVFNSDYNLFYTADGLPEAVAHVPGTWHAPLATVQTYGLELHSQYGPPQFVNAPVSYHRADEHRVTEFTPTRVIMDPGAMTGLAVGDHVEIDWDGVVRTVTDVGADYIEVDVPKPEMTTFKACFVINWKDNTDYTLDLALQPTSQAVGAASDGGDVGTTIDTVAFRDSDFDGDGARDVPRWGAAAGPPAKPGDADGDGDVDLDDFVILKTNFGTPSGATQATGDFDGDGDVDLDDFVILKTNFGQ
ncbi:MAG: right-handed parallel beta-helix repeat-containing protein, partial [Planctomycetota bacterium]